MKTSATQGAWSVIPRSAVTAALALLMGLLAASGSLAAFAPQELTADEKAVAVEQARIEAAGWPNFDSTAFGDQVAKTEAAKIAAADEAAGWPDFDSTAIDTSASLDVAGADVAEAEMLRGDLSPISFGG